MTWKEKVISTGWVEVHDEFFISCFWGRVSLHGNGKGNACKILVHFDSEHCEGCKRSVPSDLNFHYDMVCFGKRDERNPCEEI